MGYQPHYIASYDEETGLNQYYEPFLIPEKAFASIEDALCWRGRVMRRPGFQLLGRLRRLIESTENSLGDVAYAGPGPGTVTINVFTAGGASSFALGQPNAQMALGTTLDPLIITIGTLTLTDNGDGTMTSSGGVITGASINYNTGDVVISFLAALMTTPATISGAYYPNLPVMGLTNNEYQGANRTFIAFDTKYAYVFNSTTNLFERMPDTNSTKWSGTDYNFFWTTNYYYTTASGINLFWATNNSANDPIRYYDGTKWVVYENAAGQGKYLDSGAAKSLFKCLAILPYFDSLLFINTWEGVPGSGISAAVNFPNRIRWTVAFPLDPSNANAAALYGPTSGYLDAPVSEPIIGVAYVKNVLLVKFPSSSWKLTYTGIRTQPFIWQKINSEFGCKSTFSLVPFDRGVFGMSQFGITSDDSVNVTRIDMPIPQIVFDMVNTDKGAFRVYGIRDFISELVYWAFPREPKNTVYPNKVLVLNYRNNSYSIYNDSFTTYGYYYTQEEKTWAELTYRSWEEWNTPWNSGFNLAGIPSIVAGNQQGFVETLESPDDSGPTQPTNDISLYIQAIDFTVDPIVYTSPSHNLAVDDIVLLTGIIGTGTLNPANLNNQTFIVSVADDNTFQLKVYTGDIEFPFDDPVKTGLVDSSSVYMGNGYITKINSFNIKTKVFAPFYELGSQCRLGYIDYLLDKTVNGKITSDIYINESDSSSVTDSSLNPSLMGINVVNTKPDNLALIPFQAQQDKIWHRQFVQSISQNFQVVLSMSPEQTADIEVSGEPVVLHAIAFYLSPNARLVQ